MKRGLRTLLLFGAIWTASFAGLCLLLPVTTWTTVWEKSSGHAIPDKFMYAMFPQVNGATLHDSTGNAVGTLDRMLINSQREVTSGQPIVVFDAKGVESRVSMHELSYVCDAGLQKQFHGAWENMITQWGQETDYRSATITNEPQSDGRTNVTLEIRWVHDRNDRYVYVTDGKTADAIEWTSSSAGNVIQAGIGFVRNGGIAAVLAGMCVVFISSRMKRPSDDYQKEQCSVGRSK